MSTQLLWKPQRFHNDLLIRASVDLQTLSWHPTTYPGISFGCFESDPAVQDHPVTMLTRFDPEGFFPLHGHPGGEEILVLEGCFQDETGVHLPGTYMLNPEAETILWDSQQSSSSKNPPADSEDSLTARGQE